MDANVCVRWYVELAGYEEAQRIEEDLRFQLLAPDLIHLEVGNALRKMSRFAGAPWEAGERALANLAHSRLVTISSADLAQAAFRISRGTNCSVYDATYVALTEATGGTLVTADQRLLEFCRARGTSARSLI